MGLFSKILKLANRVKTWKLRGTKSIVYILKRTTKGWCQTVSPGIIRRPGDRRNGFTNTSIHPYVPPQPLRREAEKKWEQEKEPILSTSYSHLQTTPQTTGDSYRYRDVCEKRWPPFHSVVGLQPWKGSCWSTPVPTEKKRELKRDNRQMSNR